MGKFNLSAYMHDFVTLLNDSFYLFIVISNAADLIAVVIQPTIHNRCTIIDYHLIIIAFFTDI